MPEVFEVHQMVSSLNPKIKGMVVMNVKQLGSKFAKEKAQQQFEQRINAVKTPFKIKQIRSRGKEICVHILEMNTKTKLTIHMNLGQGAFLYLLKKKSHLDLEPFKSDGFLAFIGKNKHGKWRAFCIVDCRTFRHQVKVKVFVGEIERWKKNTGPCVLTENAAFKRWLKLKLQTDRKFFLSHSIAFVMFMEKYVNGFGNYSVSEILHRMYCKHNVLPWDSALSVFSKPGLLNDFFNRPLLLEEEQRLYLKNWDPACFGPKQISQRRDFRFKFLQTYRKKTFFGHPTTALMFIEKGKKTKRKSIYTAAPSKEGIHIPTVVTTVSAKIDTIPSEARFEIKPEIQENWFRCRGSFLTEKILGVGSQDFMHPSMKASLVSNGLPANKEKKGPDYTLPTVFKTSPKSKKQRRSGDQLKREKKKLYSMGICPRNPPKSPIFSSDDEGGDSYETE